MREENQAVTAPTYILKVCTYASSPWVNVWLIRRDGAANSGQMHGQILRERLGEILDLFDHLAGVVEVEWETSTWPGPTEPPAERDLFAGK